MHAIGGIYARKQLGQIPPLALPLTGTSHAYLSMQMGLSALTIGLIFALADHVLTNSWAC